MSEERERLDDVLIRFRLVGDEATQLKALALREMRKPTDQVRYMVRIGMKAQLTDLERELLEALKPFAHLAMVLKEGEFLNHKGVYVSYEQAKEAAAVVEKATEKGK